ncbi:MAG: hypothetical protein BRC33_03145 [Cyanobacteria bacterium SW_9_44_58]|nr:MAG: hypothetical protein BRC33_03145 [Cyanobacteria bacterium SW_9_44_58]
MSSQSNQQENANQDRKKQIQEDILSGRSYSLADAIAREGGNFLKGESPVPKLVQVRAEINLFIDNNLPDSSGALQSVLKTWVNADPIVSKNLESPLESLAQVVEKLLTNQALFYEMVQQADWEWGQMYGERPYFQKPGQPAHPEDEYSHESVAEKLAYLKQQLGKN